MTRSGLQTVLVDDFLLGQSEDFVFLSDFDEGLERFVEVCDLVCGGNLRADTRLALGNYREEEADRVDALFVEVAREVLRELGV